MAFQFPLQSVLEVRRRREEEAERLLGEAATELREAQRTLEWVRSEIQRGADEWNGRPSGVVQVEELRERYARVQLLERARLETESRLAKAETTAGARRAEYLQARQEREVLDEMEKKQLRFHEMELLRKEARRNDDLLMGRRSREAAATDWHEEWPEGEGRRAG